MKLSRRGVLALAGAGMAALKAQTPATPPATSPADRLATARENNSKGSQKLTQFAIPMSTEPSFVFRP